MLTKGEQDRAYHVSAYVILKEQQLKLITPKEAQSKLRALWKEIYQPNQKEESE